MGIGAENRSGKRSQAREAGRICISRCRLTFTRRQPFALFALFIGVIFPLELRF